MFERARRGASAAVPALAVLAALTACSAGAQQNWEDHTSARQLSDETTLDVRVQYGAGTLELAPAAGNLLYRYELRYDESVVRPVSEYNAASGRLRLGMENVRRSGRGHREGGRARVELAPSVPTRLRLEFGAGEASVELGGMALESLDMSTGASSTEVRFDAPNRVEAGEVRFASGASSLRVTGLGNARAASFRFQGGVGETTLGFDGEWTRDATARIEMGLGSVRLRLPRDLGVRIERRGFMSSFEPAGMERRDGVWFSRNWDEARHRLTLNVEAALGSVDVSWID